MKLMESLLEKLVRGTSRDHSADVPMMRAVEVFVYLQLLDLLTTALGLELGLSELSPFIQTLMHLGPVTGVAISKVGALALGALCIYLGRQRVLVWINYWFAGLVAWNLSITLHFLSSN